MPDGDERESHCGQRHLRFWEIDLLRGTVLVMMVAFHILFDLYYFGNYDVDLHVGFWPIYSHFVSGTFILLVGVSLSLALAKAEAGGMEFKDFARRGCTRGLFVLGIAMGISLLTWMTLSGGHVVFGVLHLIGLSIIISMPFMRLGRWNLLFGSALISLGLYVGVMEGGSYWLVWAGYKPDGFHSVDYFPMLPWFGIVLLGIYVGDVLYPARTRRFHLPDLRHIIPIKNLAFLGRHSLAIYVLHQPFIVLILHLTGVIDLGIKIPLSLPF